VIAVAVIPVGLIGMLFAPGDSDRIGSTLVVAVGIGIVLGVIWYLDRKIDKRTNHRRDFPLP
jgi:undecaprenyl pyrophosphate phosphatase UppP